MQQQKGTLVLGYVIQTWRAGDEWYQHEDVKAYAPKGQLPEAWKRVQADPEIVQAKIFSTTQLVKQAHKRKLSDSFKRNQED
jgi:hypothetical protein